MPDPALHVPHPLAAITLVPGAVELLRGRPELYDQVAGQVLRLGLAPLFPPEADQGRFVTTRASEPPMKARRLS
jgi:hypothetical protein